MAFVLVAVLGLGQIAFAHVVVEPYPALAMPGFEGAPQDATMPEMTLVTSDGEVPVNYHDYFDTQGTHSAAFMVSAFRPGGGEPRRIERIANRARALLGMPPLPRAGELLEDPETAEYFRTRIAELEPDLEVEAVRLAWHRLAYTADPSAPVEREEEPLDVVTIGL